MEQETVEKSDIGNPKSGNTLKIAIIVFGVLILGVGVFCIGYYLGARGGALVGNGEDKVVSKKTTEPAETSNWKTYIDQEYQYSFKYPPAWVDAVTQVVSPDYFWRGAETELKGAFISVFVADTDNSALKDEFTYRFYDYYQPSQDGFVPTPYEKLSTPIESKLAGENALKYFGREYYSGSFLGTLAIHNNKTYIVTLNYEEGRRGEFEKIYDGILSTFKFLETCSDCPLYAPPLPGLCKSENIIVGDNVYFEDKSCVCPGPLKCVE